jgi:hypothetical protein
MIRGDGLALVVIDKKCLTIKAIVGKSLDHDPRQPLSQPGMCAGKTREAPLLVKNRLQRRGIGTLTTKRLGR